MAAGEQPVLAADGNAAQGAFGGVMPRPGLCRVGRSKGGGRRVVAGSCRGATRHNHRGRGARGACRVWRARVGTGGDHREAPASRGLVRDRIASLSEAARISVMERSGRRIGCVLTAVGLAVFAVAIGVLVVGFTEPPAVDFLAREPLPESVSGPTWQGGTAYCFDTGAYYVEVRWRDDEGRDVMVYRLRDGTFPQLSIEGAALVVNWSSQEKNRKATITGDSLQKKKAHAKPFRDIR